MQNKRYVWLAATLALLSLGLPPEKAFAFNPTSELTDVSPDHWAYSAIKSLVDKYQVMEGFHDNTFRGGKYVTRYEMAAVLSKVMNRVEDLIGSATGTAPTSNIPPSINPEDLRTIAKLQQEFRDELSILKGKADTMDQRLSVLESRVRLHGALEWNYRTFTNKGGVRGHDNARVVTDIALDSKISPELSYSGDLAVFNNGVQGFANGHLWAEEESRGIANTVGDSGQPLYVRRSYFSWAPDNWTLNAGVMSFSDTLPVGSAIKNGFDTLPVWSEGQSGYGFVGTPAIGPNNSLFKYPMTGRAAWLPGVNVAQDILDPNSSPINLPGSAPAVAIRSDFGPVEWGLGMNTGVPGANGSLTANDIPASFPVVAVFNNGYTLAKAGLDLGLARAAGYYHQDNGTNGHGSGATIDLGNDELGLSASYANANRPSLYGPLAGYFHEGSLNLASNNFLGTGMGVGLAAKAGKIGIPLPAADPYDWTSTGGYVKFPLFSIVPSLTLAAQTSGKRFMNDDWGSGWSLIAELQLHTSLPKVMVEYDRGKFTGGDKGLFTKEVPSDELLSVSTGLRF